MIYLSVGMGLLALSQIGIAIGMYRYEKRLDRMRTALDAAFSELHDIAGKVDIVEVERQLKDRATRRA